MKGIAKKIMGIFLLVWVPLVAMVSEGERVLFQAGANLDRVFEVALERAVAGLGREYSSEEVGLLKERLEPLALRMKGRIEERLRGDRGRNLREVELIVQMELEQWIRMELEREKLLKEMREERDVSGLRKGMPGKVMAVAEQDSLALVALYNSTDGPHWKNNTNWLIGPVSTWYGVMMVREGRVIILCLEYNKLSGSIPAELGNMTNLELLFLSNNQLTGSIPPELGNLTNLWWLELNNNQLTGSIPPELGNLRNVARFFIYNNQLSGSIPPELGNLTNLEVLDLSSNQLSGSIPPELGNLTNLGWLYLYSNQLTGSIPPELGNLTNLRYLSLSSNQLSGSIPPELGNLTNLGGLYLSNNFFTDLPDLRTPCVNLYSLYVENNRLTFEDIEPNIGISDFIYAPQDSVDTEGPDTVVIGQPFSLSVSVGGTANQYQWYKDGVAILGAIGSTYSVASATEADRGVYHCEVTNTIATGLTIYSRKKSVFIDLPLPVQMDEIYATSDDKEKEITIHWVTQSEVNCKGFNIWRSVDNIQYTKLNTTLIQSHGNNSFPTEYSFIDKFVEENITYYYKIEIETLEGESQFFGPISGKITSSLPLKYALYKNYPNPFNNTTVIEYDIPEDTKIKLVVYDLSGRMVRTLVDSFVKGGHYKTSWDGCDENSIPVPNGIYLLKLVSPNFSNSTKIALIR